MQKKASGKSEKLILEIAVILCCKLAIIFCLWHFFFNSDKRIEQTPENVASGILDRTPVQLKDQPMKPTNEVNR